MDVLTLTATPIPRTLQMAVTGLRDLALITTAPDDRRAVRTVVTRWDDHVVREAVTRELARGGQCFYVYNRVDKLYEKAQRLQELVPNARIAVAHGQMSEVALEEAMLAFVDGSYDVLALDGDHRERTRYSPCEHDDHRPRRSLRTRAALSA